MNRYLIRLRSKNSQPNICGWGLTHTYLSLQKLLLISRFQHLTYNKNCKRACNFVLADKFGVSLTIVRPVETISGYMLFASSLRSLSRCCLACEAEGTGQSHLLSFFSDPEERYVVGVCN